MPSAPAWSAAMDEMLITTPSPRSIMCGSTAWQQRTGPRTFTRITRSQRLSGISQSRPGNMMPALLMRMSIRPNSSSAARTIAVTLSSSVTSVRTASARTPSERSSSAVDEIVPGSFGSVSCSVRAATTMWHPSFASSTAMFFPTPRLLPVIIATLSASFIALLRILICAPAVVPHGHRALSRLEKSTPGANPGGGLSLGGCGLGV